MERPANPAAGVVRRFVDLTIAAVGGFIGLAYGWNQPMTIAAWIILPLIVLGYAFWVPLKGRLPWLGSVASELAFIAVGFLLAFGGGIHKQTMDDRDAWKAKATHLEKSVDSLNIVVNALAGQIEELNRAESEKMSLASKRAIIAGYLKEGNQLLSRSGFTEREKGLAIADWVGRVAAFARKNIGAVQAVEWEQAVDGEAGYMDEPGVYKGYTFKAAIEQRMTMLVEWDEKLR